MTGNRSVAASTGGQTFEQRQSSLIRGRASDGGDIEPPLARRLNANVGELGRLTNAVPARDRLRLAPPQVADRRRTERQAFEYADARVRRVCACDEPGVEANRIVDRRAKLRTADHEGGADQQGDSP